MIDKLTAPGAAAPAKALATKKKRGRPPRRIAQLQAPPAPANAGQAMMAAEAQMQHLNFGRLAFSLGEIGLMTGLSRRTLQREIKAGALTAKIAGRRTIVLHSDLKTYLEHLPQR